jgi:hypothetical protein
MKINFEQILTRIGGEALPAQIDMKQCPNCGFRDGIIAEFGQRTLKSIVVDALQATFPDEQLSGEEKAKRWLLATRIYAHPQDIDLTAEEISTLKKVVGKGYGPLIVGQAYQMLDPIEGIGK